MLASGHAQYIVDLSCRAVPHLNGLGLCCAVLGRASFKRARALAMPHFYALH